MRSFDQSFSSPVQVMAPQAPTHPSYMWDSSSNSALSIGINQSPLNSWTPNTPPQSIPSSAAGRKRSRDEAAQNLEEYFPPAPLPEPENEDEWEYGEGMTLIKPKKNGGGYIIEASSQTGTWAEEKAEEEKAKAMAPIIIERPVLRPNKSQRLDLSATPVIAEEVISNAHPSPGSPERFVEPTVDDFTRHLGIGWSSVNTLDVDIQAAARGWAKYIENNYPVTDAKIRLQSKGLASYLVEANEGYFLFGEDLKQGRLVSTSLDKTWINLSSPVPMFDSDIIMNAGHSSRTELSTTANEAITTNGVEESSSNGFLLDEAQGLHSEANVNTIAQSLPTEMDMS